jgi:hypothetical protein
MDFILLVKESAQDKKWPSSRRKQFSETDLFLVDVKSGPRLGKSDLQKLTPSLLMVKTSGHIDRKLQNACELTLYKIAQTTKVEFHKIVVCAIYGLHFELLYGTTKCLSSGSNQGPLDLRSNALPTELFRRYDDVLSGSV